MNYNELSTLLNLHINSILNLLPREFTSNGFINVLIDVLPNEYSRTLLNAGNSSYRNFHIWISRWYLQDLVNRELIVKLNHKQECSTRNGNKSMNQVWQKIR